MSRKYTRKSVTPHRGLGVRRREFDAVASAYDFFRTLRNTLLTSLDGDIASLRREIAVRESLKVSTVKIAKK